MFEYKDEYAQDSPFFPILLMFRYRMTVRVGDSSFQSNANLTVNGVAVLQDCALGCGQYSDITVLVSVYCTCWWYSLCTFQYRQHYEQTGSDHFDCCMYTNLYFFMLM